MFGATGDRHGLAVLFDVLERQSVLKSTNGRPSNYPGRCGCIVELRVGALGELFPKLPIKTNPEPSATGLRFGATVSIVLLLHVLVARVLLMKRPPKQAEPPAEYSEMTIIVGASAPEPSPVQLQLQIAIPQLRAPLPRAVIEDVLRGGIHNSLELAGYTRAGRRCLALMSRILLESTTHSSNPCSSS